MSTGSNIRGRAVAAGLLAAMTVGALPAPAAPTRDPAVVQAPTRRRRRKSSTKKPTTRKGMIRALEALEREGNFTERDRQDLQQLRRRERLARGRLGRRMLRGKVWGIGVLTRTIKAGKQKARPTPLQVDGRIPRALRAVILRQDGRPVSGRQWRKLVKAERRREKGFGRRRERAA